MHFYIGLETLSAWGPHIQVEECKLTIVPDVWRAKKGGNVLRGKRSVNLE
jgi:hypothetical protein